MVSSSRISVRSTPSPGVGVASRVSPQARRRRLRVDMRGSSRAPSMRAIVGCATPVRAASARWVRPARRRACRNARPGSMPSMIAQTLSSPTPETPDPPSPVNRYYDPATGQFLTRDPLAGWTRAVYSYVRNNPLNTTDPMGLFPECGAAPIGPGVPCPVGPIPMNKVCTPDGAPGATEVPQTFGPQSSMTPTPSPKMEPPTPGPGVMIAGAIVAAGGGIGCAAGLEPGEIAGAYVGSLLGPVAGFLGFVIGGAVGCVAGAVGVVGTSDSSPPGF